MTFPDFSLANFAGFAEIASSLPVVDNPASTGAFAIGAHLSSSTPIRDLFAASQVGVDTYFHNHVAIRTIVNYMKKTIYDKDYSWQSSTLQRTIFPGIDKVLAPDLLDVPGLDDGRIRRGGCALLIKAFYNGCRDFDDQIDLDKANQHVADLNTHIHQQKTPILIQYYRWAFFLKPSDMLVDCYKKLLLSKPYRALKNAQASHGMLTNSNLEMFDHFVKLAACGASDDTVTQIYNQLVHPSDGVEALDPGVFSAVTPTTWRVYSGWLSEGLLDWTDLAAQNLDSSYLTQTIVGLGSLVHPPTKTELGALYVVHQGYHKNGTGSSSCFAGPTLVLMASGELQPISDIKIGDRVATHVGSKHQPIGSAKVAFVSKPPRGGRALYAHRCSPNIKFTSTHPFVGEITRSGYPTLRFVDPLQASALNPTWRSFTSATIDPSDLIVEDGDATQPDEIVYDLVFEQNITSSGTNSHQIKLPTYIVTDGHGEFLTTISEAPIAAWLPHEVTFVQSVLQEIENSDKTISDVVYQFVSDESFACKKLNDIAKGSQNSEYGFDHAPALKRLEYYLKDDDEGQLTAFFIERLFSRLGRAPSNLTSTAWAQSGTQSSTPAVTALILHRLQVLDTDVPPIKPHVLPTNWRLRVWQSDQIIVNEFLKAHRDGPNSLSFHHVTSLVTSADLADDSLTPIRVELSSIDRKIVLHGKGDILKDSDTWINLIHFHEGSESGTLLQAVIKVEIQNVDVEALKSAGDWSAARMNQMATTMGRTFGRALLEEQ